MNVPGRNLSPEQQELLYNFMSVVGIDDPTEAVTLLDRHGWDPQTAAAVYFAGPEEEGGRFMVNPGDFVVDDDDEPSPMLFGRPGAARPGGQAGAAGGGTAGVSAELVDSEGVLGEADGPAPPGEGNAARPREGQARQGGVVGLVLGVIGLPFRLVNMAVTTLFSVVPSLGPAPPADGATQQRAFMRRFHARYGNEHPPVFDGGYRQLTREARTSQRLCLVYIHSFEHQLADDFCRATLADPAFAGLIAQNGALFWMGDISDSEGLQVSNQLTLTTFPFLGLLCPSGSSTVLAHVLEGAATLSTAGVVGQLGPVMEGRGAELVAARVDAQARDNERRLREEQEAEYRRTMAEDEARMRRAEEERERARAEAERARLEAERVAREAEERQRAVLAKAAALPPEPPAGPDTTDLIVRLPEGGTPVKRRFLKQARLAEVVDFIESKGVDTARYRLATNFPKRIYSDLSKSLAEEGLLQSQLILHEVDQ